MHDDKPAGYWKALEGFLGVVSAQRSTPQPARCDRCSQPMPASTPAADAVLATLPPCGICDKPMAECTCSWRDKPGLS